jgi:ATP-dependent HslUV protease subunit HslV
MRRTRAAGDPMSDAEGLKMHGTTIVGVRKDGHVALAGDGQVSLRSTIVKATARKVRRLAEGKVLAGFSGSTADAMNLMERFEGKLKGAGGNLARAAVDLAKEWRSDKMLRRLEAMLLVADTDKLLLVGGNGDVLESDLEEKGGVLAVGSGGPYALAAARAMLRHSDLPARAIAENALRVASEICVYTNSQIVVEDL